MYNYAKMLDNGDEIEEDKIKAAHYYTLAADQGDTDIGDEIGMNKIEAARYYKMAADQGHVDSMFKYAYMAENGDGNEENKKEATLYYKLAQHLDHLSKEIPIHERPLDI